MKHLFFLTILAAMMVGCGGEVSLETKPEDPKVEQTEEEMEKAYAEQMKKQR